MTLASLLMKQGILFSPAVISVVTNSYLLAGNFNGVSLAEQDFSLAELIDDLFK